jgi:hypothetical protein
VDASLGVEDVLEIEGLGGAVALLGAEDGDGEFGIGVGLPGGSERLGELLVGKGLDVREVDIVEVAHVVLPA